MGVPIGIHILQAKVAHTVADLIAGGHNNCICIFHIFNCSRRSGQQQCKNEGKEACPNNAQYLFFVVHNLFHLLASTFPGR